MMDKSNNSFHFIDFENILHYGLSLNYPEIQTMRMSPFMKALMGEVSLETRFIQLSMDVFRITKQNISKINEQF